MKKLLMMSVLTMCMAAPAIAEDKMMPEKDKTAMMEKKSDMWFSKMDSNGDGMISMAEHEKFGQDMFTKTDMNKDGNISMDEMKAMKMKEHAEMKKEMPKKSM